MIKNIHGSKYILINNDTETRIDMSKPSAGMVRYNGITSTLEVYDGTIWHSLPLSVPTVELSVSATEAIEWAMQKMQEEKKLQHKPLINIPQTPVDTNQYMIDNATAGVFFDIGANVGYYTIQMAKKATKVYAFEPSILNFETLTSEIANYKNVVAEKIALSNTKSTVKLFASVNKELPVGWGGFSINPRIPAIPHLQRSFENYEEVPTITLDQYCFNNNITGITGMKIDVEAAEEFVIEGAMNTLKNNNILISLETHLAIDCVKIYKLLTQAGYSVYKNGAYKVDHIEFDQQYICRR